MTNQDTTSIDEQIDDRISSYGIHDKTCGVTITHDLGNCDCQHLELKALISDQVAKAKKRTAEEIFYILWEKDGSYFQYNDPPKEMLEYLATLNGVKNK